MGTLSILILLVAAAVALLLGSRAYRRAMAASEQAGPAVAAVKDPEHWGVRIVAASGQRACPSVRDLLGKDFPIGAKPQLPSPNCEFRSQCRCRYVKLFDRRNESRRSGFDRRVRGPRFAEDHSPRRSGRDRRRKDIEWF